MCKTKYREYPNFVCTIILYSFCHPYCLSTSAFKIEYLTPIHLYTQSKEELNDYDTYRSRIILCRKKGSSYVPKLAAPTMLSIATRPDIIKQINVLE